MYSPRARFKARPKFNDLLAWFSAALLLWAAAVASAESGTESVEVQLDGVVYQASIKVNARLAKKIVNGSSSVVSRAENATHFHGSIDGFADSAVRISEANGHWRGVVVSGGLIYRIDEYQPVAGEQLRFQAELIESPAEDQQLCQAPGHVSSVFDSAASNVPFSPIAASVSSAMVSADCPEPVDGVCLLPELELAYDQSYQAIFSAGETVLDRATRELNELELFFEQSFNYRLSSVSMTFLDAAQDAPFAGENTAAGLLDSLRLARNRGEIEFIQSPRSIFHFVTGRNFPPVSVSGGTSNVVGIAYLDVFCDTFGLNTGVTDAGDAFFVSLVMAHEIGHNLGAEHDDPVANGCSANTHVMTPSIGGSAGSITEFSTCSSSVIRQTMTDVLASSVRSQCLDFPIDSSLVAEAANPVTVPYEQSFSAEYNVLRGGGSAGLITLGIDGIITDPSTGQFDAVSVTSGSCTVFSDNFSCQIPNASSAETLTIAATVVNNASSFEYTQSVNAIGGDGIEMLPSNNVLVTEYLDFGELVLGDPGTPSDSQASGGGSSAGASSSGSSGGGGGGGSFSVLSLASLIVAFTCRRYRKARH